MRRTPRWAELAGWIACSCALFACGEEKARPRNVVIFAIDGLRRDEVGAYGGPASSTPTIDAIAREGVRFDAAYACAASNVPSLAALWTGKDPWSNGVQLDTDVLPPDALCLAEHFRERGYDTFGVTADFRIGRARGLDQGFESSSSVDIEVPGTSTSQRVAERVGHLLGLYGANQRPYFLFAHFSDPKAPLLRHDADGESIPSVADISGGETLDYLQVARPTLDAAQTTTLRALYSGEVRAVDRAIASIWSHLKQRGELDDTVVVILGTAGYEWNDRTWIGDGHSLHDEVVRVPLVIRAPGWARGTTHRDVVSLAGVARTVLALAGLDVPSIGFDAPAFGDRRGPQRSPDGIAHFIARAEPRLLGARSRSIDLRGIRSERWKLIFDASTGRSSLFDLAEDPSESNDLGSADPLRVDTLSRSLRAKHSAAPLAPPAVGAVEIGAASRHDRGDVR